VKRIPALDGVRALAALSVLLYHTEALGLWWPSDLAMDVFFALSGFLIGGLLMDDQSLVRFFVRRAARIWPLYFAAVALIVATETGPRHWMLWTFLGNIRRILGDSERRAAAGLWSLAVEEHWYLILPWIVRGMKRRELPLALGLVALGSIALRYWFETKDFSELAWYAFTFTRLDCLCFGAIAAWILRERPDWTAHARPVAIACGGAMLVQVGRSPWADRGFGAAAFGQTAGAIGTAALLLLLARQQLPRLGRVLGWAPLAWVGEISYGVYILQAFAMEAVLWAGRHAGLTWVTRSRLLFWIPVLATTLLMASLSRRFFESPIITLAKRWTSPNKGARSEPLTAGAGAGTAAPSDGVIEA
jgi:peptidoglycan/LPS O-acetylase OafA/YrhL